MQERIKERTLQPGKEINERNVGSIYRYNETISVCSSNKIKSQLIYNH